VPRYSKQMIRDMTARGFVLRKATLDERADKLVFFSSVALRRTLNRNDAKCLLQNWEPYGPDKKWFFPPKKGKAMPRNTPKKLAKKAAKSAARVKAKKGKAAQRAYGDGAKRKQALGK
jgi:hypothetical protein